jgi:hypothetical protein
MSRNPPKAQAKGPEKSGPDRVGTPVLLAGGGFSYSTSIEWLESMNLRVTVFLNLDADNPLDQEAVALARQVLNYCRLAKAAIQAGDAESAAWAALSACNAAWMADVVQGAKPKMLRDYKRQRGTHKQKRPELQEWIDQAVSVGRETAKELWNRAPEWITDQIGFDRFTKRVTEARKKLVASK